MIHTLNAGGASLRIHGGSLADFGLDLTECQTAAKLFDVVA